MGDQPALGRRTSRQTDSSGPRPSHRAAFADPPALGAAAKLDMRRLRSGRAGAARGGFPGGGSSPTRPQADWPHSPPGRKGFAVRCAAPLFGDDATVVLRFDNPPQSLDEVIAAADAAFTKEAEGRRGPLTDPFRTQRLRVYDWAAKTWLDLSARRDWRGLLPGSVIFADPVAQVVSVTDAVDEGWRAGFERQDVPLPEKVRMTWEDCVAQKAPGEPPTSPGQMSAAQLAAQGGFTEAQFCARLQALGVGFDAATQRELFNNADADMDGVVTMDEWMAWSAVYPNMLECVYFRGRDHAEMEALRAAIGDAAAELKQHDRSTAPQQYELRALEEKAREMAAELARLEQLQRELEQVRVREAELRVELDRYPAEALRSKLAGMERRLAEYTRRQDLLKEQEGGLMQQEVQLERQRRSLVAQKEQMRGTVEAFDRYTKTQGSPRRARERADASYDLSIRRDPPSGSIAAAHAPAYPSWPPG